MEETLIKSLLAFFLSFLLIKILKPISKRIGLVDKPNQRKQHDGSIPLIGGLCIYLTLLISGFVFLNNSTLLNSYYAAAGIITVTGVLDDRFDLSVRIRVIMTFIASGLMIAVAGVVFKDLGDLFGLGDIHLPHWFAIPFTLIATFGVINALNMMDGIDGLSSGVSVLSLVSILIAVDFQTNLKIFITIIIAAILAFQIFNLQLTRRVKKVFLGDAGSMLIGFTIIITICYFSQVTSSRGPKFEPVTGLFFVGLPLIDMVSTVIRRVTKNKNPFKPDRTHAHHILMHAGFSPRKTLVILLTISAIINGVGILLNNFDIPSWLQLFTFISMFSMYFIGIKHAFRLSKLLQKFHGARNTALSK
ncbi:hypothetical protein ACWJJH_00025 [Endozoicomonadaceae bacterium StTr2]